MMCPVCNEEYGMITDQIDKYLEIIKQSNEIGQKRQMLAQQRFFCKNHPDEIINYYCKESKEFLCHICMFNREITKQTSFLCQKAHIIDHSNQLISKLDVLRKALEKSAADLKEISEHEKDFDSDELLF